MTNKTIRRLIGLGAVAIGSIFAVQAYWMIYTWHVEERKLDQKIFIALKNVAASLAEYNAMASYSNNPVRQMSADYYVVHVNDMIDANVLEHYLTQELLQDDVLTSFEYAIYDCADDNMVYGNQVQLLTQEVKEAPHRLLPRYDEYTYYFGVFFPSKSGAVLSGMQTWLLLSGMLLLVLAFFCYALVAILRQKRLSELQKDFIDNMTHEFKTPIATINVSADVLLNQQTLSTPERLTRYATVVKHQALRLNQQVDQVLQIAQMERRTFALPIALIDVHTLISETVAEFSVRYPQTLIITTDLQATQSKQQANEFHMINVLHNLLDNAIKYSPTSPRVEISTLDQAGAFVLKVKDFGCGIEKKYIRKIFGKFFRVPVGNVHNTKGFGLGLYYVKQVCKLHRWQITATSTPNQGSTFTIIIPS